MIFQRTRKHEFHQHADFRRRNGHFRFQSAAGLQQPQRSGLADGPNFRRNIVDHLVDDAAVAAVNQLVVDDDADVAADADADAAVVETPPIAAESFDEKLVFHFECSREDRHEQVPAPAAADAGDASDQATR